MNSKAEEFYKIFECGSKEELYQKIKSKDPIVQPLIEYYEHRKKREKHQSSKEKPKFSINSIQKKQDHLKQKELSSEKKKATERGR